MRVGGLVLAVVAVGLACDALAQDTALPGTVAPAPSGTTKAGYNQEPTLEGGNGVTTDLAVDDAITGGLFEGPRLRAITQPWFDFKKRLNDELGLQLAFSYQALYQSADQTLTGVDDAAAVRGQIQGAWTLLGRDTNHPGRLTFRVENRQTAFGEAIPPSSLASQFLSPTNTGTGFSDFGTVLSELAWRQSLFGGKLKFIGGKISAISWYNTTAMSSSMRGLQNTALESSLSKPAPGRGLGFGFGVEPFPNFVIVAGIHDANAKTTSNPFDTIKQGEFYYSTEFRYYLSGPDRWTWDSLKLQLWYQDPRKVLGIPASIGATFEASYLFDDRWYPFVLGGISDGNATLFKTDLVAGLGVAIDTRNRPARDAFGIAFGWGDPSNNSLRDQYTGEMFYRLQVTENFAVTPSVQLILNPAANPLQDRIVVGSVRARLTF